MADGLRYNSRKLLTTVVSVKPRDLVAEILERKSNSLVLLGPYICLLCEELDLSGLLG